MALSPWPAVRWLPVAPFLLVLSILFSSCGDSGPSGPDPLDAIATVTVTPAQVTVDVGSDMQLSATVKNGHGETVTSSVTWSSSASGVASVNSSGLVSGVAEGTATITAAAGGKSGTTALTVNDPFPPGQPTNVTATPISDTWIRVTWTDASATEDSFKIEREQQPNPVAGEGTAAMAGAGTESGSGPQLVKTVAGTVNANVTAFDDTGLQAGSVYRYWVSACNENGCSDTQQSANDIVTYTVLVITTETLPVGWEGEAYNQTLTSTGGGGEPQWTIFQGSTPPGMVLIPTGTLSGTPTNSGTTDFTVQASGGGQDVTKALSLTVYGQVVVETLFAPNGGVGFAYDQTLEATGGDGTYVWAQEGGTMPPGLVLGPDGTVSGTPTAIGTYEFQVVVHSAMRQATATVTITIFDSVCPVQTELPFAECQVLHTLHGVTDGDNWVDNTDWLATLTPCSWFGVTCEAGSVDRLDLRYNNLSGPFPTQVQNLPNLTLLNLAGNDLTGSVPPELGNLSKLEYLTLTGNELVGSIPPELGNLNALKVLDLEHNDLTGTIPPSLGNLTELITINLRYQDITGPIPPEFGNLTKMQTFFLGSNELTGPIPAGLGNMTDMRMFDLSGNNLTGPIPPELGNLNKASIFYLHYNELTGTIPPELANLAEVTWFGLSNNQLTGTIPPEFGSMPKITHLLWGGNQFTGSIPPEFGNATTLKLINLDGNQLSGSIPPELGNLVSLEQLYLQNNQLTGDIPLGVAQIGGVIDQTQGVGRCLFRTGNPGLNLPDTPDYRAADLDADGSICQVPFLGPIPLASVIPLW